ncbi:Tubulin polyglutamylase ttll6 [Merluccius polli]|uniref:Tubulin polyglutamylase ttll6 n=1 Tax=Merluccius polli TaxID=89951 RepID=A0AA47N2U4_MERPO|nr:Tubulin polyglutamylase ttll6 [Merluccius polli]
MGKHFQSLEKRSSLKAQQELVLEASNTLSLVSPDGPRGPLRSALFPPVYQRLLEAKKNAPTSGYLACLSISLWACCNSRLAAWFHCAEGDSWFGWFDEFLHLLQAVLPSRVTVDLTKVRDRMLRYRLPDGGRVKRLCAEWEPLYPKSLPEAACGRMRPPDEGKSKSSASSGVGAPDGELTPPDDLPPLAKNKKKKKRYESVRRTAYRFGLREALEGEDFNLYWTDSSVTLDRLVGMKPYQKVNHFPGMMEVCRKDMLARNLNRMAKRFPKDYSIFPHTWCLPADYSDFQAYARAKKHKTFICKPDSGSQGKGIFLVKSAREVPHGEHIICQLYIAKPLIIDSYKFDLRIYVLVTSCDPFHIFIYQEGLARFCTSQYCQPAKANMENICMHLTNYAINKRNENFVRDEKAGSKRKLSALTRLLHERSCDVTKLWLDIDDLVIKTLASAHSVLSHSYHTCFPRHTLPGSNSSGACFELLGFDVLLDQKLKPWLLEFIRFPLDNQQLHRRIKANFMAIAGMPGVVGAFDGMHIKIIAPSKDEDVFVNRKKVHSINTQIVFDATFNIIDVVAKWPGSTHDPRILMGSGLRQDVALDTLSQSTTGSPVNHSPSFTTDSALDREVKDRLLYDTLVLVNLTACDRRRAEQNQRRQIKARLQRGQYKEGSEEQAEEDMQREQRVLRYEDSHLGAYRRIFPREGGEKYDKYFLHSSSLFQETAASRAREKCTRLNREGIKLVVELVRDAITSPTNRNNSIRK